jgi:hypothetical protein
MRYEKTRYHGQLREKLFLIVIHGFLLVKATMNALRICKMRNGVSKTPSIASSPQLSKLLYNCKLKNKEAL